MRAFKAIVSLVILPVVFGFLKATVLPQSEGSKKEGSSKMNVEEPVTVLSGFDPVALLQGENKKGKENLVTVHEGYRYFFSNIDHQKAFEENPAKYAVQDQGLCPVAKAKVKQMIKGDPEIFAIYQGRIYLFSNADAKAVFERNPQQFVSVSKKEGSGKEEASKPN